MVLALTWALFRKIPFGLHIRNLPAPVNSSSSHRTKVAILTESGTRICELNDHARIAETNRPSVSEISFDKPDRLIMLTVTRMQWRNAFQSLTVSFGGSSSNFEVRRHPSLHKRQNSEPTGVSTASSTISFPVPPSSSPTPKAHDARGDVGFQFLNQAILPPSLPGADGVTLHGPLMCVPFQKHAYVRCL